MNVLEHLQRRSKPFVSFEIIPPLRGANLRDLLALVDALAQYRPPFIDITSHAAKPVVAQTSGGSLVRRIERKRPGTLGICALIQHKYGIDAVPHMLCEGFTREETEDFLIELHYLGVENVLALRGDAATVEPVQRPGRQRNETAEDLVLQIDAFRQGRLLHEDEDARGPRQPVHPLPMCIGVAGYPEKHMFAASMEEDIAALRRKVDAGADYVVTQMFFENAHYVSFVQRCREEGITVPIIPGLKVLTSRKQLDVLPRVFACEIPQALRDEVCRATDDKVMDVGAEWAAEQAKALVAGGAPAVHFYVMQRADPVAKALARVPDL